MRVVHETTNEPNTIAFEDLAAGDTFRFAGNNDVCIKASLPDDYAPIRLSDGTQLVVLGPCIRLSTTLRVHGDIFK